jgi:hypothetical protein
MSNAKGEEVDELVVVETKKFVWRKLTSGRKGHTSSSTSGDVSVSVVFGFPSLRRECSKQATPHAADSAVGHSLVLFVHPSIHLYPSTISGVTYSSMPHGGLLAYGANAPSRPAQRTSQISP